MVAWTSLFGRVIYVRTCILKRRNYCTGDTVGVCELCTGLREVSRYLLPTIIHHMNTGYRAMNGGVNVFFDIFLDDSLNMSLAFELTFFEYCFTEAVV